MFEIDFLPVGENSKSGDAICGRITVPSWPRPAVFVIDGGYKADGEALVDHITTYYDTDIVDVVIATHSDADHINGLNVVLRRLTVRELLMHLPWEHDAAMGDLAVDARRRLSSGLVVADKFERALASASDLCELARNRNVQVTEPFAGVTRLGGLLTVVGPTRAYYDDLLPSFRCAPATKSMVIAKLAAASARATRVLESWHVETLTDAGTTSAENNSSAVTYLATEEGPVLFTGDAGMPALTNASDYMDHAGLTPSTWRLLQIPHHGSHHNVGPTILDRLLGPKGTVQPSLVNAVASAAADDEDHPARKVLNAFTRRGCSVNATNGRTLCLSSSVRPGWEPVQPFPLYPEVEGNDTAA